MPWRLLQNEQWEGCPTDVPWHSQVWDVLFLCDEEPFPLRPSAPQGIGMAPAATGVDDFGNFLRDCLIQSNMPMLEKPQVGPLLNTKVKLRLRATCYRPPISSWHVMQ